MAEADLGRQRHGIPTPTREAKRGGGREVGGERRRKNEPEPGGLGEESDGIDLMGRTGDEKSS